MNKKSKKIKKNKKEDKRTSVNYSLENVLEIYGRKVPKLNKPF
jgi:hypothetical protein